MNVTTAYIFCESTTATATNPYCIRPLSDKGPKLDGGVDTPSLCDHVQPPWGWDLDEPFSHRHIRACPRCVEAYEAFRAGEKEADRNPPGPGPPPRV